MIAPPNSNFKRSRDVNNTHHYTIIKDNDDEYNSTSIENIPVNTTKTFAIGSFHSLDFILKGSVATVTIGSQPTVTMSDGQSVSLSYNELNTVTVTIVTDNNTTVLCTIKKI